MNRIARRRLLCFRPEDLRVAVDHIAQRPAGGRRLLKLVGRNAQETAGYLDCGPGQGAAFSETPLEAKSTLASDNGCLDGVARARDDQQRNHATFGKINALNRIVRLKKDQSLR